MSLASVYTSAKAAIHTAALVLCDEWAIQGIAVTRIYQVSGSATTKCIANNKNDASCSKTEGISMRRSLCPQPIVLYSSCSTQCLEPKSPYITSHPPSLHEPEIYTNFVGRYMIYAAMLREWVRELGFRV